MKNIKNAWIRSEAVGTQSRSTTRSFGALEEVLQRLDRGPLHVVVDMVGIDYLQMDVIG